VRTKTPLVADRMLDAAAQLFGTQRFHEVRMEDIAAEAGVGKGTLYRYWSDKEELYLALVERSSGQMLDRLHADLARVEGPRDKLEAVVAAFIAFFDEQPHLFDLIQRSEVMAGPGFPWRKTREEAIELVTSLLREGAERGEFVVQDAELTSLLILGGVRAIIRFGKKPRPRGLARRIADTYLHTGIASTKRRQAAPLSSATADS